MKHPSGITLVELLISLAVIGIIFLALIQSQLLSFSTSARAKNTTIGKAAAVLRLEKLTTEILYVNRHDLTTPTDDEYNFKKYYDYCRTTPTGTAVVTCEGSDTTSNTSWKIKSEHEVGIPGEGLLLMTVTATPPGGATVTLLQRLSCYDVYPAPTSTTPDPCPKVATL